jgi:5-methylcytosine-specific restriction enzyme A
MVALVFQEKEHVYLEWLFQHSQGYVLNTYSEPSDDYLVLHSAQCKVISRPKRGAHPACFTGNGYIKVCADDIQGLKDWITELGFNDFTKTCELCNPTGGATYRRFNWTRDELILALDLYHSVPGARGNVRHPAVVELSELLQELPIHPPQFRPPNFRNSNGVVMKLGNFLVYDPDYAGAGLPQGAAKLEQGIWNEFAADHGRLKQIACAIREHYPALKSAGIQHLDNDDGAEEGGILHALHRYAERDQSIIRQKKKDVFEKNMALKCEVCEFDFAQIYGELGNQFAECHHIKPVAKMKSGERTKQSDLSIVCANCHRMLHRGRDLLSIAALKAILEKELALVATKGTFK